MSAEHDNCYLCASDEGILLDIFGDAGQTLRENIETCLSVKIGRSDALSGKICHKCAYELDSCRQFLGKYKRLKDSGKNRVSAEPAERCCLCGEGGKKVRLLEINGGNSLKNSLRKIGQAFDKDFLEDRIIERLCVCLGCRYNVDVLSDLKNIYRGRPSKMKSADKNGLRLSNLPKTRTRVVSRKTTYIPLPKLNRDPDCDSNASVSSSDASLSRKRSIPPRHKELVATSRTTKTSTHFRTCEECNTMVEHGVDMYRYHQTGLTVCKDCWLTMDPEKISNRRAKKLARAASETSTKLCVVFLKDVLSNPAKYSNIYRIERDKHGNATFLITDESSENEDREKTSGSIAGLEGSTDEKGKRPTKRSSVDSVKTEDVGRPKRARASMRRSQEPVESPRIVAVTKTRNGTQSDSGRTIITRGKRGSSESTTHSESWANGGRETRAKRSNRGEGSVHKVQPIESPIATRSGRTVKSVSPVASLGRRREGTRGKRRPDSSKSRAIPAPASSTAGSPDRSSDESISSSEPARETLAGGDEANGPLEDSPKTLRSDSEIEKPYSCSVCQVVCISKLVGKSHELTHEKQPEVKLRRVVVPSLETIDEISSVQEAAEQSRAASDPAESADLTEDHSATVTAVIDEESTVHSVITPTIEDKDNSRERSDDQRRDNEDDQQSQRPANEAEAILVETSEKSAVAAEEKREEEEKKEVQEKEDAKGADETMHVNEVKEDKDKTERDGGEDSVATESLEAIVEAATVEDEPEKPVTKFDDSNENRVESNKSPELSQGAEPREPEELGSDKQRTAPETEPMINDSAKEDLLEEKISAVTETPTESSPVKDVSATEPKERLVDHDGSNGGIDSVENEKKEVVDDEEQELASLKVVEDAEPELASLKVVDEDDEESELVSLKVVDEEEKEVESSPSKVQEKLVEVEEKEPESVPSESKEKMVEAEEEGAESSSLNVEKKVVEVKEHEEPESISSTVEEKVLEAEEKEPVSALSKVVEKLVVEREEEKEKEAEQEKEEEEQEKGDEKEEQEETEEKEVEKEEEEVEKEKTEGERDEEQEGKEEKEEEEEKEIEERQRIVDPKKEEKPSTEVAFREVFDLASDEIKKRLENGDRNNERLATPAETLENISLEIQKSADISEVDEEPPAIGGS